MDTADARKIDIGQRNLKRILSTGITYGIPSILLISADDEIGAMYKYHSGTKHLILEATSLLESNKIIT